MMVDIAHVILDIRPSCFSACSIEKAGKGLGMRLATLYDVLLHTRDAFVGGGGGGEGGLCPLEKRLPSLDFHKWNVKNPLQATCTCIIVIN